MREKRLLNPGAEALALCSNKLFGGVPLLDAEDIEELKAVMFRVFDYGEIGVLAFAIVPTGYQALLHVPKRRPLTDAELVGLAARLYETTPERFQAFKNRLATFSSRTPEGKSLRASHQLRIHHFPHAIANIQQRFSFYFLAKHHGLAKVWADRYKCLPVEDRREVLLEAAAAVDAMPKWATPSIDPAKYSHCSFGEAIAGNVERRRWLITTTGSAGWAVAKKTYQASIDAAVKPRRTWNMSRVIGKVSVARLTAAASRRIAKQPNHITTGKSFEERLAELKAFKKAHGHCDVPPYKNEFRMLGRWLGRVRARGKRNLLPPRQRKTLEALGVRWESKKRGAKGGAGPVQAKRWEEHYQKLIHFKNRYGHTRVPRTFASDKTFASWIWRQRDSKRKGKIEPHRKKLLDDLDFEWAPRPGGTKAARAARASHSVR